MLGKGLNLLYDTKLIFSKSEFEIVTQGTRTWGSEAYEVSCCSGRLEFPTMTYHLLRHILHFASYSRCVLTHRLMHHGAVMKCSKVKELS